MLTPSAPMTPRQTEDMVLREKAWADIRSGFKTHKRLLVNALDIFEQHHELLKRLTSVMGKADGIAVEIQDAISDLQTLNKDKKT